MTSQEKLQRVREVLEKYSAQGVLIPHSSLFQTEYLPARDAFLSWLTGFTGSAGLAVVLLDRAALFVDGRYTLQAPRQVDTSLYECLPSFEQSPYQWVSTLLSEGGVLLFDPELFSVQAIRQWEKSCQSCSLSLTPKPFLDEVWAARPGFPEEQVKPHPLVYAGQSHAEKKETIIKELEQQEVDTLVLTQPESIAWFLNIRGQDLPYTPIALSFLVIHKTGTLEWVIHPEKVPSACLGALGPNITLHPIEKMKEILKGLAQNKKRIWIDPSVFPYAFYLLLKEEQAQIVEKQDPCFLLKARKNPKEQEGIRQAHQRDGAAVASFLAWLEGQSPWHHLTEADLEKKIFTYRAQQNLFQGESFPTISAFGAHGAVVHYRSQLDTQATLKPDHLYLIDSGGQYLDGTTDITRTIYLGEHPTSQEKDHFTGVLKGHIALAMAHFPVGTTGHQLDVVARFPLWQKGLDYQHGTGHGVGAYLNVHEGPCYIGKRGDTPLEPGMVLSNEPGFYQEGQYGIRLENLILVQESKVRKGFLQFETLTLVPIDRKLIDVTLLTGDEINWLNEYHQNVRQRLKSLVSEEVFTWLKEATKEI